MAWYKILIQVLIVQFLRITMCVPYWWCTKHAQLIMGTWPIYKKHFLQLILTKKTLPFDKISPRDFYFFPFFSICTCATYLRTSEKHCLDVHRDKSAKICRRVEQGFLIVISFSKSKKVPQNCISIYGTLHCNACLVSGADEELALILINRSIWAARSQWLCWMSF